MEIDHDLREVADDLSGELAWNPGFGWLYWDGKVWESQFGGDEACSRVSRWREQTGRRPAADRHLRALLRQLQGAMEIDARTLDAHPDLFNAQNGVVDLRTGALRPHDPALRLTKVAAVDYDPDAQDSAWDRVLAALPETARGPLESLASEAVTGHSSARAVVLHGPGQSGKTAFIGTICDALGAYARSTANWPQPADLRGVRLSVAEIIGHINTGQVRLLVGSDEIVTRQLHREAMTFRPSHSSVLVSTHQPDTAKLDEGARRRLESIGFEQLASPDATLRPRLKETGALRAALAWAVSQAVRAART